jgi:uncharacterized membrane protein YhiD involved in acid resistance
MPEWLLQSLGDENLAAQVLLTRLGFGLFWGLCVAVVYYFAHGRRHPHFMRMSITLVMLSALISMVSIVIGHDIARAFSLVGALSIVRFRTVVDDTRDTAFVMFAVVVGMAAGAGQLFLPALAIPLVGGMAVLMTSLGKAGNVESTDYEGQLFVKTGLNVSAGPVIKQLLDSYFDTHDIRSIETSTKSGRQEIQYLVSHGNRDQMPELIQKLQQIEGVESARLRCSSGRNKFDERS